MSTSTALLSTRISGGIASKQNAHSKDLFKQVARVSHRQLFERNVFDAMGRNDQSITFSLADDVTNSLRTRFIERDS